jgi:hypothetical protein
MGEQITIDGRTYKLVALHGRCGKCGMYVEAKTFLSPLMVEFPDRSVDQPHLHLTICCWRCGSIINLVDIAKDPLKNKRGRCKHEF